MKKLLCLSLLTLAIIGLFSACEREQTDIPLLDAITTSEDVLAVQDVMEDNDAEIDERFEFRSGPGGCPTVTVTPEGNAFPKTIIIDYGATGCTGPRGRLRQGQIRVQQSAPMSQAGASRTITFNNFRVDGALVEATITLTNSAVDAQGNITLNRNVTNGRITYPNGQTATWTSAHVIRQTAGGNTPNPNDNAWEVTGAMSGVNRRGTSFEVAITQPLIKAAGCNWIVSGVKVFSVGNQTRTLDYGNGACDNDATLTLANGRTRTVRIRGWWR